MVSFRQLNGLTRPLVIGHRGSPHTAYENTLESFESAIAQSVDAVECDIRRTADGTIVVHHDKAVRGSRIKLLRQSFEEATRSALAQNYRIPSLAEVLRLCAGRVAIIIELKEAGYEQDVIEIVQAESDLEHTAFMSFHDDAVRRLKAANGDATVGLLLGQSRAASLRNRLSDLYPRDRLATCRADFVAPNWHLVRFGFLKRLLALGYPVFVWTVNQPRVMKRLALGGVTALITNYPTTCRRMIL